MKKHIKQQFVSILLVLLAAAFPVAFLYFQNAEEEAFKEIYPVLLGFCGVGILLYFLCRVIIKSPAKSGVISAMFLAIFANFSLIEVVLTAIFPGLKYWHTASIILVIGLHIAYVIWRFLPEDISVDISKVVCSVFGVLLLANGIMSMPKIVRRVQAEQQFIENREPSHEISNRTDEKPNVYLFLFDEYANFPQMEQQYGYDNRILKNFLAENNFSVSYTSQNESNHTTTIVTNLVNLDYVVDETTPDSQKMILRKSGALFSLMREKGYHVQIADNTEFLTNDSLVKRDASSTAALTLEGEKLTDLLLRRTIIYPFYQIKHTDAFNDLMKMVDYVCNPEFIPSGDTFSIVYMYFPHTPFIVDANGHEVLTGHAADWDDPQYYLGQYQYATKIMIQMLDNILEHDADAVILLQSDHGARGHGAAEFTWENMTSPLNAVYYQGDTQLDIEGLSTLNTLRYVLNRLIATDFEMLELPTG